MLENPGVHILQSTPLQKKTVESCLPGRVTRSLPGRPAGGENSTPLRNAAATLATQGTDHSGTEGFLVFLDLNLSSYTKLIVRDRAGQTSPVSLDEI